MKTQRLRITQKGWETFTDTMMGIRFEGGISVEPVPPSVANQLGAILSVEAIDDAVQIGAGAQLVATHRDAAEVKIPLTKETPNTVSADQVKKTLATTYTREDLEKIADQDGITGLRAIGEQLGVKGRGINELISEILRAQG